jgi:hypothetical protein
MPADASGHQTVASLDDIEDGRTFDYILLADHLGHTGDVQSFLEQLHRYQHRRTRVIIIEYSRVWEPLVRFGQWLRGKAPASQRSWLSPWDMRTIATDLDSAQSGLQSAATDLPPVVVQRVDTAADASGGGSRPAQHLHRHPGAQRGRQHRGRDHATA